MTALETLRAQVNGHTTSLEELILSCPDPDLAERAAAQWLNAIGVMGGQGTEIERLRAELAEARRELVSKP